MGSESRRPRRGGRNLRRGPQSSESESVAAIRPGLSGGSYRPLSDRDIELILTTAFDIMSNVGMADPLPDFLAVALKRGCSVSEDGRLLFPKEIIKSTISMAAKRFTMPGQNPRFDLEIEDTRVYYATAGEAVLVPSIDTGDLKPASLLDVYDFARLADQLENIHWFAQTVSAVELTDDIYSHDLNVAYAVMSGTRKHCSVAMMDVAACNNIFQMAYDFAGGEEAFRERPFLSVCQSPVVSPLRFAADNCQVLVSAVRHGAIVEFTSSPQSGATGPATLAGNLAVVIAEILSVLIMVNMYSPGHPAIVGAEPFVSDLRTGAFTGGNGEVAVMSAAAAQILNYLGLPSHTAAGMTDSKAVDAQAGSETALTVSLSALAGCNLISQVFGMMGGLMICSYEMMVVDNEIIGGVQRALRGIEVNANTLGYEQIKTAVYGDGHFLGAPETLAVMKSEYVYPDISNRMTPNEWESAGRPGILDNAQRKAKEILAGHFPRNIPLAKDQEIRAKFGVLLPEAAMSRP